MTFFLKSIILSAKIKKTLHIFPKHQPYVLNFEKNKKNKKGIKDSLNPSIKRSLTNI